MPQDNTSKCVTDIIDSMRNCYTDEELFLITPRDIKELVEDWGKNNTDKERAIFAVTKWIESFKSETTINRVADDSKLDREKRFELLRKTIILVERWAKEKNYKFPKCNHKAFFDEKVTPILDDILSLSDNRKTRLLNQLAETGYNILTERGYYDYLFIFLLHIIHIERYIYCEIDPRMETLRLQNSAIPIGHEPPKDEYTQSHLKRLKFYREIIAERKEHMFKANSISNVWGIDFNTFAKLYRIIFNLSNKAIQKSE